MLTNNVCDRLLGLDEIDWSERLLGECSRTLGFLRTRDGTHFGLRDQLSGALAKVYGVLHGLFRIMAEDKTVGIWGKVFINCCD